MQHPSMRNGAHAAFTCVCRVCGRRQLVADLGDARRKGWALLENALRAFHWGGVCGQCRVGGKKTR